MNICKLYIVGNGFDIYHGVQSSYDNFKVYLKNNDYRIFDYVETYLTPEDNWSDLEESLASLEAYYVTEQASNFLVSYGADDWRDSYHHSYQYEIEQIVESLSYKLIEKFTDWISQLHIPDYDEVNFNRIEINTSAMYLNFNYTNTLEKIYGVNKSNILYIHGCISAQESDLILGHSWDTIDIPDLNNEDDYERLDVRVLEGNEIINRYFHNTFKQTSKIIESNSIFFNSLENISEVYVLGHSLSNVDIEYFKAIIKYSASKNIKWVISYYSDEELIRHKNTIKNLGIYDSNVKFIKLSDLVK